MDINLGLSASATGTVDVITATYSPAPTLVDKKILFLVASGANTSATPTFSPNGLTAHTITKLGGSPLVAGDIAGANFVAILVYNLANTRWELLNPKVSFTPTLAQVLLQGSSTGGISITSPDGKSTAEVIDGAITFTYRDGAINNYISIDPTQITYSFSDGVDSGSTTINAAEHTLAHSQLIQLNAPSVTKNGDEVATETNINAQLAQYNLIRQCSLNLLATQTADTYFMLMANTGLINSVSGNAIPQVPNAIYIDSSDYPSVNGLSPKLRIRANMFVNNAAPTVNFTFGLYPITVTAPSGGANARAHTIGSLVTGSDGAAISTPSANSNNNMVSSDFALPANGLYVICVTTSGTIAANCLVQCLADLQITYKP